jgi:hypothetical protein
LSIPPTAITPNVPTLLEVAGMGRVLLNLQYDGLDEETPIIKHAVDRKLFRIRLSYELEPQYPIFLFQFSVVEELKQPLNIEAYPDVFAFEDVQGFLSALYRRGRYELSVHANGTHLASVYEDISATTKRELFDGVALLVQHFKSIPRNTRNYMAAVKSFERKHPIGEDM